MSKKLTIEEMQDIAKSRRGLCLSKKYINAITKLRWQCKEGHIWETRPHNIKRGKWCPSCSGNIKLTIEEMQDIAKSRRGLCLSKEYINAQTKLKWKCEKGHIWEARPNYIKGGTWCPDCSGIKKMTIEDMQVLAKKRKGKCLSKRYKGANNKLVWVCEFEHKFQTTPAKVKNRGQWCPICGQIKSHQAQRLDISLFSTIAKEKGGMLISKSYKNCDTKLTFKCSKGHEFENRAGKIKSGQWCPYCSGNKLINPLARLQEKAKEKGGKCLSKKYINTQTHLAWQCNKGHIWKAIPSSIKLGCWCPFCMGVKIDHKEVNEKISSRGGQLIKGNIKTAKTKIDILCFNNHVFTTTWNAIKNGNWCPKCRIFVGEEICRVFFEKFYKVKFKKAYPNWLKHNGQQLELDGYNEDLKLAFEHQGIQHLSFVKHLHKTNNTFKSQVLRDKTKVKLCKANKVTLFVINDIARNTSNEEIMSTLLKIINQTNPKKIQSLNFKIDIDKIYRLRNIKIDSEFLNKYKIDLLSYPYKGVRKKHLWKCHNRHEFERTLDSLKIRARRGYIVCPICAQNSNSKSV